MLKVCEIYSAIQGESSRVGEPCVIVRLGGCNLDCSYCDTPHARHEFSDMKIGDIVDHCVKSEIRMVLITGGEPLVQKDVRRLLKELVEKDFTILLETNGSLPLDDIPEEVVIILDYKLQGSGMTKSMNIENLSRLRSFDELKMVISSRKDFDEALRVIRENDLTKRTHVLFSPAFGRIRPEELADWILEEKLPVRLNLQIHKYIWEPTARGR